MTATNPPHSEQSSDPGPLEERPLEERPLDKRPIEERPIEERPCEERPCEEEISCQVLVGVCTYNEATNIKPMVERVRSALPDADVLIVDDHSPDGTSDIVRNSFADDPHVQLIVRMDERGLGGAIRYAINKSVDGDYDFFINLDADLSHDPAVLPVMLDKAVRSPEIDVVIGSRYVQGGKIIGWPWHRRVMSRLVNRFAVLCLRLPVSDCSGSMRCYRVSTLRSIDRTQLRSKGYALLEELLVRLHRKNAVMTEVPITFTERQRGSSKLTLFEAARSISQMIRLSLSR